jgi:hypothetical protein
VPTAGVKVSGANIAIVTLVYGFLLVPLFIPPHRPFTSAERLLVGRSFPRRVATP